jgi:hypothetical protein
MAEITFEVEKSFGVLSEKPNGWKKEVNLVSWNGREAKFDIREWNEDHTRMSKGLTFTKEEILKLKEILESIEL